MAEESQKMYKTSKERANVVCEMKASRPLRPFLFALSIRKPRTRNQIKRDRKSKTSPCPTIFSLPNELIAEVVARVAVTSANDFFNVVLSCKVFQQIAGDNYILRHVSLEKFPVIPWGSAEQAFFLDKCKRSGHPEALYREGVIEYFSFLKVEEGLNCLDSAAKVGHLGASYVLGVILLCVEKTVEEGRRLLSYVRSERGIGESRKKLKDIINVIWQKMQLKPKPNSCPMQAQHRRRGWPSDSDDEVDCETCGCHSEVLFVCNLLRGIITY